MEQHQATLLGVVIAVAIGVTGLNVMANGVFGNDAPSTMANEGSFITGHVTYTVFDEDGNIKAYEQTDNVVTRTGIDCAISFLFDNATVDGTGGAAAQCVSISTGYTGFNFIGIGNSSSPTVNAAETGLTDDMDGENGNDRIQDATVQYTLALSGQDSAVAVIETASPFTFTNLPSGATITESGLFDATTAGIMFAKQSFSTAVTASDSLSVKWTITLQ